MTVKRLPGPVRHLAERVPPAVWYFALLGLGWGLDHLWPLPLGLESIGWRVGSALVLFGLGSLLASSALVTFSRGRTTAMPFGTPAALLTGGPFRLSRNPLYVALVLALAGFAPLLDAAWMLLATVLLASALDRLVIPSEERLLAREFGPAYADYSTRVRRWL